jgi:hypothetical protein
MPQSDLRSASAGPPFDPESIPQTVVLVRDRSRLRVSWRNGETAELDADSHSVAWSNRHRL